MSAENTYHFSLVLSIIDILTQQDNLTKDDICQQIIKNEGLTALDEYQLKNLKERVFNKLKYLDKKGRISLTKNITPIKTIYYTASIIQHS